MPRAPSHGQQSILRRMIQGESLILSAGLWLWDSGSTKFERADGRYCTSLLSAGRISLDRAGRATVTPDGRKAVSA